MLGPVLHVVALTASSDPVPDDNNVVAGWVGAVVMIGLAVAVVFILRSFTKQLKKVNDAADKGVYGEPPDAGTQGQDVASKADRDS